MSITALTIDFAWHVATLMLVQSTLLIAGAYFAVKLLRLQNAALLSVIYRGILLAILAAPLATMVFMRRRGRGLVAAAVEQSLDRHAYPDDKDKFFLGEFTIGCTVGDACVSNNDRSTATGSTNIVCHSRRIDSMIRSQVKRCLPLPDGTPVAATFRSALESDGSRQVLPMFRVGLHSFPILLLRFWRTHQRLGEETLSQAVPAEPFVQALCDRLAHDLKVTTPQVICSPYFTSPFLAGVRHPQSCTSRATLQSTRTLAAEWLSRCSHT